MALKLPGGTIKPAHVMPSLLKICQQWIIVTDHCARPVVVMTRSTFLTPAVPLGTCLAPLVPPALLPVATRSRTSPTAPSPPRQGTGLRVHGRLREGQWAEPVHVARCHVRTGVDELGGRVRLPHRWVAGGGGGSVGRSATPNHHLRRRPTAPPPLAPRRQGTPTRWRSVKASDPSGPSHPPAPHAPRAGRGPNPCWRPSGGACDGCCPQRGCPQRSASNGFLLVFAGSWKGLGLYRWVLVSGYGGNRSSNPSHHPPKCILGTAFRFKKLQQGLVPSRGSQMDGATTPSIGTTRPWTQTSTRLSGPSGRCINSSASCGNPASTAQCKGLRPWVKTGQKEAKTCPNHKKTPYVYL